MMTWRERVIHAEQSGRFTASEVIASAGWLTCAVGEHHAAMPEVVRYRVPLRGDCTLEPADAILREVGGQFWWAIAGNNVTKAHQLLDDIEERVRTLKRGGSQ